jgi:hypothetical protein
MDIMAQPPELPLPVPEEPPVELGGFPAPPSFEVPVVPSSTGGVPGLPVALSAVRDNTAIPPTKLTFCGLWVERL